MGRGKNLASGKSSTRKQYNTPTTHAEVDALNNLRRHQKCKPVNLIVVRFNSRGDLCSSRPCYHCLRTLMNSGLRIRFVYYSCDGEMMKEKFDEMIGSDKTTISSGMRRILAERKRSTTR